MGYSEVINIKNLDSEDLNKLRKLGQLYTQAKLLILYSEEIDPSARSNIQVIKELRDALDHLMRVVVARLCDVPPIGASELDYCSKNLDKAIGHVYRAAFDALDGTVLSLREKIVEVLKNYPQAVIKEVIPGYWEFRSKLDALTQNIAVHRASKDVAGNVGDTLNLYVDDAEQMKNFYTKIISSGPALDECYAIHRNESKKENRHHIKNHIIGGLGYSAIGGGVMLLLTTLGCIPKNLEKETVSTKASYFDSSKGTIDQQHPANKNVEKTPKN